MLVEFCSIALSCIFCREGCCGGGRRGRRWASQSVEAPFESWILMYACIDFTIHQKLRHAKILIFSLPFYRYRYCDVFCGLVCWKLVFLNLLLWNRNRRGFCVVHQWLHTFIYGSRNWRAEWNVSANIPDSVCILKNHLPRVTLLVADTHSQNGPGRINFCPQEKCGYRQR